MAWGELSVGALLAIGTADAIVVALGLVRRFDEGAATHGIQVTAQGLLSARRGRYRVVYSIHDDEILVRVVRIAHRADVYG